MLDPLFIGPAGWSYPDWDGKVYPPKRPRSFDSLVYISRYFNLIEINNTFYRIPSRSTCKSWVERVASNPNFMFTVKAPQNLTHTAKPVDSSEIAAFKQAIEPLRTAGILGFVLIQFPWSFRFNFSSRARIQTITRALSPLPQSLEVRHGQWAGKEAIEFIRDQGLTLCGIDQPQIGNSLTPDTSLSGPHGTYFRLHGRNAREWFKPGTNRDLRYNYLYSAEELSTWSRKIESSVGKDAPVFVIFNNHFRGQAAANALELKALLLREKVEVPPALMKVLPRLQDIASSVSAKEDASDCEGRQGSLFNNEEKKENSSSSGCH